MLAPRRLYADWKHRWPRRNLGWCKLDPRSCLRYAQTGTEVLHLITRIRLTTLTEVVCSKGDVHNLIARSFWISQLHFFAGTFTWSNSTTRSSKTAFVIFISNDSDDSHEDEANNRSKEQCGSPPRTTAVRIFVSRKLLLLGPQNTGSIWWTRGLTLLTHILGRYRRRDGCCQWCSKWFKLAGGYNWLEQSRRWNCL